MFSIGSFTVGTLFGVLITAAVNHWLAKSRDKESREKVKFMEAGAKLRESFSDEMTAIHPHIIGRDDKDAFEILNDAFSKHLKAVQEFRHYLDSEKKKQFETAWREYYGYDGNEEDIPFLEQYSVHVGSQSSYRENCKLALSRLNRIIDFTNT